MSLTTLGETRRMDNTGMIRILFDVVPTVPRKRLESECTRLEHALQEFMLQKSGHDAFKAQHLLMGFFTHTDFNDSGSVSVKQLRSILNSVNCVPEPQVEAHWFQQYAVKDPDCFDYRLFVHGLFGIVTVPHKDPACKEALAKVREAFLRRGMGRATGLSRSFRIMDNNRDQKLSKTEFVEGITQIGVDLDEESLDTVYRAFDRDGDGVGVTEFLSVIRGPLAPKRRVLVDLAFQQLDKDGSGVVEFAELCSVYDASRHPEVLAKRMTEEEVIKLFAASWDRDGDGAVTLLEFVDYYKDLSASIDNDDYFELMIRNAWHLSGGTGWAANTSNLRVMVEHGDGSQEVVCITDDLGLDKFDNSALREKLEAQGIKDIVKISFAD